MSVYIEKTIKIFQDDFAYIIRPNRDVPESAIDLAYEEAGDEMKYICITQDVIPALIQALQESLDNLVKGQSDENSNN